MSLSYQFFPSHFSFADAAVKGFGLGPGDVFTKMNIKSQSKGRIKLCIICSVKIMFSSLLRRYFSNLVLKKLYDTTRAVTIVLVGNKHFLVV